MQAADATTIKNVVVPAEHGASVMLGESLLAGLLLAGSLKGFWPAFGWVFLFFMSHPLKIFLKDKDHHVLTGRTLVAGWFSLGFGVIALAFFAGTYLFCGPYFLWVLIGVIPLGLIHLMAVVKEGKKEFVAELFGVLSLGAVAASIVLAAGHSYAQALTLWTVLAVRAVTSIIYVRERLNQRRSKICNYRSVNLAHMAGVAVLGMLVLAHLIKPLILMAGLLFIIRLWLMYQRQAVIPKNLGLQESLWGVVFVLLLVFSL